MDFKCAAAAEHFYRKRVGRNYSGGGSEGSPWCADIHEGTLHFTAWHAAAALSQPYDSPNLRIIGFRELGTLGPPNLGNRPFQSEDVGLSQPGIIDRPSQLWDDGPIMRKNAAAAKDLAMDFRSRGEIFRRGFNLSNIQNASAMRAATTFDIHGKIFRGGCIPSKHTKCFPTPL